MGTFIEEEISSNPSLSAFRMIGVMTPVAVATATAMSIEVSRSVSPVLVRAALDSGRRLWGGGGGGEGERMI